MDLAGAVVFLCCKAADLDGFSQKSGCKEAGLWHVLQVYLDPELPAAVGIIALNFL